jgi:hypothetical protein
MGLSDREYMRPGFRPAPARAGWLQRLRFWLWRLLHRR